MLGNLVASSLVCPFIYVFISSFSNASIHLLINSFVEVSIYSLIHSSIRGCTHPFKYSLFMGSFIYSSTCVHGFIRLCIHGVFDSQKYKFIHSLNYSFIRASWMDLFAYSFFMYIYIYIYIYMITSCIYVVCCRQHIVTDLLFESCIVASLLVYN